MMVEPQREGELKPGLGAPLLEVLVERRGQPTIVRLASGNDLIVYDVVWGRDLGDVWEHVTANASPPMPDREIETFWMSDVVSIVDPDTRRVLAEQTADPGAR
jgi:hypothetical protein